MRERLSVRTTLSASLRAYFELTRLRPDVQ
jgi:hypothetical protein